MFDLSITKDLEWIKKREEQWKIVSQSLGEHLRKKQLQVIHHYFLTGEIKEGESISSDSAKFSWFPIQKPESWDYLFQYVIKNSQEYEDRFYFQFGDLSDRALTFEEELLMWDYFAGDEFKPVVVSRIPVGKEKIIISFNVDKEEIASRFIRYLDSWVAGKTEDNPKWKQRINYFLTFLPQMPDEHFKERDGDGDFATRGGRSIERVFDCLIRPEYDLSSTSGNSTEIRKSFIEELYKKIDKVNMPPLMRDCWEESKIRTRKEL